MNKQRQVSSIVAMGLVIAFGSIFATPAKGVSVRVNVKADLDKEKDSAKSSSGKSSSRSKTEMQTYTLDIQVSNTSKQEDTFDLEWYFIKRPLDNKGKKGDPVLCAKGKKSLTIAGQKRFSHQVVSEALINTESKKSSSKKGRKGKGGSSSTKKGFSGSIYAGYVVLVRQEGEILTKYTSDSKYTSKEWLAKLDGPVQKGSSSKASSSSSKKKKKKK
jgi:hypothetical protein